jgi:hypothetical protein
LLGNRPVNTSHGNEYETIGEAVFSVVRAVLVVMQSPLSHCYNRDGVFCVVLYFVQQSMKILIEAVVGRE